MNTNTITHSIRDDISQSRYDAQREGEAVPLAKHLGFFEDFGQYLLAVDMLKHSAMVIALKSEGDASADEFRWLGDEVKSILPASRCFEVLCDLLKMEDAKQFQLAFIDAMKRDPEAMYRGLRSLQVSLEDRRPLQTQTSNDNVDIEPVAADAMSEWLRSMAVAGADDASFDELEDAAHAAEVAADVAPEPHLERARFS